MRRSATGALSERAYQSAPRVTLATGSNPSDRALQKKAPNALKSPDAKLKFAAAPRRPQPGAPTDEKAAAEPAGYSFTQAPLAFEDFTAASTKARPFTPSSMVGNSTPAGGFCPERAALIASATSL